MAPRANPPAPVVAQPTKPAPRPTLRKADTRPASPRPTLRRAPVKRAPAARVPAVRVPVAPAPAVRVPVAPAPIKRAPVKRQPAPTPRPTENRLTELRLVPTPRPAERRPVDSRPVVPRSVVPRPVVPRPVAPRPAESRPAKSRPVDSRPADSRPVAPRPASRPASRKAALRPTAPRPASRPHPMYASHSPSVGESSAKVVIYEFSDFECSFCSQAANIAKDLKKLYASKVRIVFKHMPLDFHKKAHLAAQASMAAHAQGKFWEYHDLVFANQEKLDKADLIRYAGQLKLDVKKFTSDLDTGKYKAAVDADIALAQKNGVQGTPTFFANGHKLEGAQPLSRFKEVIDALLAGKPVPADDQDSQAQAPPAKPKGPVKVNLGNSPRFGPKDAKVTIVEFSDFECPYCAQMADVIKQIKTRMGKEVRFVFKHMPLDFHKKAHLAAQASEAARAQGKFWEYHDLIFANQEKIEKADLIRYAGQLKLDVKKFTSDLDTGKYKAAVDADVKEAQRLNVGGTPTFFVNGYQLPGGAAFEVFEQVINRAKQGLHPVPSQPEPQGSEPTKPKGPVKIDLSNVASYGPKDALVTVVEFSDFECPFCSQGANLLRDLKKALGDRVRFVFKHLPLNFHKKAHLAAQAAEAARAQGKFWEYHDKLFANQEKLDKADLIRYAQELKLDVKKFTADLDTGKHKPYIDASLAEAQRLQVGGTPTFYINGYEMANALPFAQFKQLLESKLKEAKAKKVPAKRVAPEPAAR